MDLKILERKPIEEGVPTEIAPVEASGVGIVKDVVAKRNFGFIAVLDDLGDSGLDAGHRG